MNVQELIASARDTLSVQRVFGEPYARDGLTLIPVAKVQGGGGGGEGQEAGGNTGHGGGFGLSAKPAGVYVIAGDRVRWEPALDINRMVLGAQVVAVVGLLTARSIVRVRRRAAGKQR